MARKIQSPQSTAGSAPKPSDLPEGSVVFVKNQAEKIRFPDGSYHIFTGSRTVVDNPELIEKLREAAAKPGNPHGLFESES